MVGSPTVAAVGATARVRRRGTALAASILAALASLGAGLLVVDRRFALAVRERTFDSFVDRLFDGAVIGSIVWVERIDHPPAAAAALVALVASFLGSYVRARGNSLDYRVEESMVTRGIRYGLLVLALLLELPVWLLWALAVFALLAAFVRASQVAKEERA